MMNRKHVVLWLLLIVVTLSGYYLAENRRDSSFVIILILSLTSIKFFGVSLGFMELIKAHWAWGLGMSILFVIYSCLLLFLAI